MEWSTEHMVSSAFIPFSFISFKSKALSLSLALFLHLEAFLVFLWVVLRVESEKAQTKMERSTPVRKPHTSTADLLTWSETPPPDSSASAARPTRPHQPSDGIRKVVFGGQVTDEEFENLNKR
ncbi:plant/F14D7-9 protein [Gossypium australe]|uniref:Plant/F14D7-9 protein n=1 Tax=Gossypium australe TaxID=47621 RepID=A0A5B6VBU8_9ROSI|nr:plant/F14D7-9 protein [Gossypium australe]